MEDKFLLFTSLILLAVFGSIETSQPSHTSHWPGYNQPSLPHGSYNTSSPYRPFATVPPPRQNGNFNSSWPYRPFATVPPPRHHGNYSAQNPWYRSTTRQPTHPDPCWVPVNPYPRPYPTLNRTHPHPLVQNYGMYNRINQSFNHSTSLYPSLAGLAEAQSNGTGQNFENRSYHAGGTYNPEYPGNYSWRNGQHY